jgi:hypothetical protein
LERTTNLSLKKPGLDDDALISDLNDNSDILDSKIGPVGNVSLQTQINNEVTARQQADTSLNDNIAKLQNELGIVCNGNKCTVSATTGQYIILKNSTISGCADGLYTATQAIPANTAITSAYLSAVSNGGLNALNDRITTFIKKLTKWAEINDKGYGRILLTESERIAVSHSMLNVFTTGGWAMAYSDPNEGGYIEVEVGISSHPSAGNRMFTIVYY